jgi:DNA-binding protein HU-beta
MNKSELISAIAEKAEVSLAKAEKVLLAALDSIVETLTNGGSISLVGFGSFGVRKRAARKVHNPRTGGEILVPETVVPFFKPGKNLKDTVDSDEAVTETENE